MIYNLLALRSTLIAVPSLWPTGRKWGMLATDAQNVWGQRGTGAPCKSIFVGVQVTPSAVQAATAVPMLEQHTLSPQRQFWMLEFWNFPPTPRNF
eukprot:3172597-Amphidinium_carterae.1